MTQPTPDALYTTEFGTTVRAYHFVSYRTNERVTRLVWPSGTGCVVQRQQFDSAVHMGKLREVKEDLHEKSRRDAEKYMRHRARQLGTTRRRVMRDWEPRGPSPEPKDRT